MISSEPRVALLDKEALLINDLIALGPAKRTRIYAAIKAHELKSRIVAGRRIVLKADYLAWVRGGDANAA